MSDTPMTTRTDSLADHFLAAIRGERDNLRWLESHQPCLALFVRALDGGPRAREKLQQMTPEQWEDLLAILSDEAVCNELRQGRFEVLTLIEAARGDESVMEHLRKHKPSFAQLASLIRSVNEETVEASNGTLDLDGSTAADVGCLIGELHLRRGEYQKAVEAFSRAIENEPSADAFEERARAYRALAELDEIHARQLRPE